VVPAPEQVREVTVPRRDTVLGIDEHQDDVGLLHRDFGLDPDLRLQRVGLVHLDSAGVDERVVASVPVAVGVQTVAGDARNVLDDSDSFTGQTIKKGGFADVGTANDSDNRFRHGSRLLHVFEVRLRGFRHSVYRE
jgi:hypothetical protein